MKNPTIFQKKIEKKELVIFEYTITKLSETKKVKHKRNKLQYFFFFKNGQATKQIEMGDRQKEVWLTRH